MLKPLEEDNPQGNICPSHKEINPKTGRCIAKCPYGKVRDEEFKCVNPKKIIKQQMKDKDIEQLSSKLLVVEDNETQPQKECPDNKEINPKTGRCIAKCPDDKVRDEEFKCVNPKKVFKQKMKTTTTDAVDAAPEQQLRPLLEHQMAPSLFVEEEDKMPPQKECPDNKEMNPKTGRCIAKCPEGKVRDAEFICVNKKKLTKKLGLHSPALNKTKKQSPMLPIFDIENN
jgi:hypothetical protein